MSSASHQSSPATTPPHTEGERGKVSVAVYVEGVTIKVLGVFTSCKEGGQAMETVSKKMDQWESEQPGTVNWLITEPMMLNTVKLPRHRIG